MRRVMQEQRSVRVALRESVVHRALADSVGRPMVSSRDISGLERSLMWLIRLCSN